MRREASPLGDEKVFESEGLVRLQLRDEEGDHMKEKWRWAGMLAILFAGVLWLGVPHICAYAGTGYIEVPYGKTVKAGSSYFKIRNGSVYYGASKKSVNTLILSNPGSNVFTNGKHLYWVDPANRTLKKKTISGGRVRYLRTLPKGDRKKVYDYWRVSAVKGKNVYLTKASEEKWRKWTYTYNTNSGRLTKIAKKAEIKARSGKYVLVQHEYKTDVSAYKLSLYQLTSSGMQKVKSLGKYCACEAFADGYAYYMKYTSSSMGSGTLYRCKLDGVCIAKKLGSFTADKWGQVIANNYKSKKCTIYRSEDGTMKTYTYVYKTGKLTLK